MNIYFDFQKNLDLDLNLDHIKAWIDNVIQSFDCQLGEINYTFCDDQYILEINKQYLDHDYYTDIISFNACVDNLISGDILISLDTVKSNSLKYKVDYQQELKRVIIHGILHFIGFDDKTEEQQKEMTRQEDIMLNKF